MALPLNALSLVGTLVWGVSELRKRRIAREDAERESAPVRAPEFSSEDLAEFVIPTANGKSRAFASDIADGIATLLEARSLEPVPPAVLSDDPDEVRELGMLGSFYAVVPPKEGLPSAGQVVRECRRTGAVVVGSLSLVLLPGGDEGHAFVLAIGGRALADSANDAGGLAILFAPEPAPATEPAPPPKPEGPEAASKEKETMNGASSHADELVGDLALAILPDAKEG